MIVLDTHVLVWARSAPERLSGPALEVLQVADEIAVADITLWELAMLAAKGRVTVDRSLPEYLADVASSVRVLPITASVAARVVGLPEEFPRDPADRLIYATAAAHGVDLVSADQAIRDVDPSVVW